jgi:predicted short-subunit dehydrogenase-like oxidoreductase (DUF2520 family)
VSRPFAGPVAIVGAGRAGGALAAALAAAGPATVRLWDRDARRRRRVARQAGAASAADLAAVLDGARLLVVAVSDEALEEVAGRCAAAWPAAGGPRTALHTAGAWPARRLAPRGPRAARGERHPAVALSGPASASRLAGGYATVSGQACALRDARRLARLLGLTPLDVDDARRGLVHLAAVLAAGDVVTLLGLAADLMAGAGVPPARARGLLAHLARSAASGFERAGAPGALTGPVARADAATLAAHTEALARTGRADDPAARIHGELSRRAIDQLVAAGTLAPATARRLARAMAARGLPGPSSTRKRKGRRGPRGPGEEA